MRAARGGAEDSPQGAGRILTHVRRAAEALLWVALLAFVGYRLWPQVAAALGVASSKIVSPSFELTDLRGERISSADLRGKVVLVNFWATWCVPCRIEMPGFQSVYEKKKAEGFALVGVSTDRGGSAAVQAYLAEHHISYPVAMDDAGIAEAFGGVYMLPSSFLIDRRGRIRYQVKGIFAGPALARAVDHLLAER